MSASRRAQAWTRAVEDSADVLGEMLVDMAGGGGNHSTEELARAALGSGLHALLDDGPDPARVEAVAGVLYRTLHQDGGETWETLSSAERSFWLSLAGAAAEASDRSLLRTIDT